MLVSKHEDIKPLLRKSGRKFNEVVLFMILMLPIFVSRTLWIIQNNRLVTLLGNFHFLMQYVTMVTALVVYEDMACNLVRSHMRIRDATRAATLNWKALIAAKWKTRDQTRKINALYARPFVVFYSNMFLSTVYIAAELILRNLKPWILVFASLNHVCFMIQILLLAYKASAVRCMCEETERELLRRLSETVSVEYVDSATVESFRFHEDWDSLRVGSFPHHLSSFWRFISVVTTCAAVVLQFDYRVVRAINDLSLQVVPNH